MIPHYRTLVTSLLLFLSSTFAFAQDADDQYAKDLLKPGTEAPDFPLQSKRPDSSYKLSDFRTAYVLLDFWASWCPDCRKDIPAVKEIAKTYGDKLVIVSQSMDTDSAAWNNCIRKYNMDYASWFHSSELKKWKKETTVDRLYHVNWIPTLYLIDPEGKVVLATVMVDKVQAKLKELDNAGQLRHCITMPRYKGDSTPQSVVKFLTANLQYPEEALQYGITGKVRMTFIVNTDGKLDSIKTKKVEITSYKKRFTKKMTEAELDNAISLAAKAFSDEGKRVMGKMDGWEPARMGNKKMRMRFTLPITFSLK